MTSIQTDLYEKFVNKTRLVYQQKKLRPLAMTRGLIDFMGNFAEIAGSLELNKAAKAHIIGLSACMSNLKTSESALGLFTDPLIDLTELAGKEIATLTLKNAGKSREKIIQWWLQASIFASVGLLSLAQEKKPSKENEILDPNFRDELILSLFFYTDYPTRVFQMMAEALEISEPKNQLFINLFELATLVFTLIAYSKEEMIRTELGEALTGKIKKNITEIKNAIENEMIKSYLELAEIALNKGEIDQFALSIQDLLKMESYTNELLQKDILAMKNLFKRLKIAYYASKENTMNMVHMIG